MTRLASQERAPVAPRFDVFGEFAVELGGDEVAELFYTDGSTTTMTAGQGGTLGIGALARPAPQIPVALFGSVGFKFLLNPSENANTRLTRIPVTLGLRANATPDIWAEAAFVRHFGTSLKGDGFIPDVDYDSGNGGTVAAGWRYVGLSYTTIRYTSEDGTEYDASNVGLRLRLSRSDF